ncbi:hypothetical protein WJX75_000093 [Coccomyxa subellipsoidea]|uniref:Protein VACUOLELESS1 n=1 Tax=Coccomyxa subellipsoidea TaxID=248742 RepID=A0ABR2YK85_9CHLO
MGSRGLSPAGEWEACGDRFYEKHELYTMAWSDVKLDQMRVACARYGGPIAMVRDDRKLVVVSGGITKPVVRIFTAAGETLAAFVWDHGRVAGLGWTNEEDLLIVENGGEVHMYSMHGQKLPRSFSLGSEAAAERITDCVVYGDGLVALTGAHRLWTVSNLEEPRPQKLALSGLTEPPHCFAVIEPRHTLSGCVEVLVAARDSVIVVDADAANDAGVPNGPITKLSVAPNGQFVAAFTGEGKLVVWTADFGKFLSEFATQSDTPPEQVAWCGTDSVVLYWEDILLLVGPYGDWVKYSLEEPAVLVTECDGVRLISDTTHELLRRVPDCLADVYRVGSTAPGALLYDARELFDQQNAKADEGLRSIVASLPEAVATCVDAAQAELDETRQVALMKAACYGRAFCSAEAFPRDRIVTVCRQLRILNALRAHGIGLPLTAAQAEALAMPVVVSRLINARRHLLALRIATLLGMGPEKVLVHWACTKVSAASDVPDAALRDAITARLAGCPGARYATVAAHAQAVGRKGLAALLLEHETCAAEQVPLLLGLGEEERALGAALDSGDADLVYLVLFRMQRTLPLQQFLAVLAARPAARSLFNAYCAQMEPELLEQINMATGVYEGVAAMRVREALAASAKLGRARSAANGAARAVEPAAAEVIRLLDRASDLYAQTKEHGFQSRSAAEWARLRRVQAELEAETGNAALLGLSLADTLRQCVRLGNHRAAARLRADFKVSDRRFWWLKLKTLAAAKDWEGLEVFAREKKSPIGIEPFVAAAKQHGAPDATVSRIIARLPDGKRKAEEYAAAGLLQEAAECAARARDSDMLSKLQDMIGTVSPLGVAVGQLKDRLQSGSR